MNFELAVNRKVEIAAGIGLALVGMPFLILGGAGFVALVFRDPDAPILVAATVSFVVGAFCVWTGARMIFGFKRCDGGVLSPFILRLGALYFVTAPILLWLVSDKGAWRAWWFLLELAFYFSAAGACLFLANRRQHPALSQSSARTDA